MQKLLEPHDVGRILDLSTAGVRALVMRGELHPAARTPRGLRLFTEQAVQALQSERAARARERRSR